MLLSVDNQFTAGNWTNNLRNILTTLYSHYNQCQVSCKGGARNGEMEKATNKEDLDLPKPELPEPEQPQQQKADWYTVYALVSLP